MYQFFVTREQVGEEMITITGGDVNHIKNVVRLRVGEVVRISDDTGENFLCEISELSDTHVFAEIKEKVASTELPSRVVLFQGIPKGERMEFIIEKSVELGVAEIVPVQMRYCVVKLDAKNSEKKQKRWQAIAEAAAKQSKRSVVPKVQKPMTYKEALQYAADLDMLLVPYENAKGMEGTKEVLKKVASMKSIGAIIGPEGGFSEEEIEMVKDQADIISLGSRILRADTAAMTTMAMLMLQLEG